jgi:hypothetical protein
MDISKLIGDLKLLHVAIEADIPIGTLWRWRDKNCIPGREAVQKAQLKALEDAVKRLRSGRTIRWGKKPKPAQDTQPDQAA